MDMLHKFEARWLEEEECSTYVEAAESPCLVLVIE